MGADRERLRMVLWEKGINANELAKELHKSPQTFYCIENLPNYGISKKLARAIHERYPDISESWLLTGIGSMKTHEAETDKYDNIETDICERCAIKDERIAFLLEKIEFLEGRLNNG